MADAEGAEQGPPPRGERVALSDITPGNRERISTGFAGLDRILGFDEITKIGGIAAKAGQAIQLCGPPGSGKRHALQAQLKMWCESMKQLYVVKRQSWNAPIQGGDGADDAEPEEEKPLLPMEVSIIHWGFDIARMSLQDKQYMKSILQRWGRGSQVLSGSDNQDGPSKRCLVLYHAHLMSSESVIFLQAFLEENHKDTVLWMTSEHPLPPRLADWCIEIPVKASEDLSLQRIRQTAPEHSSISTIPTLESEICQVYEHWMKNEPKLSDVRKIRSIVYALLHRNIRWTDGFHHWLIALDRIPITNTQRLRLAAICIKQPFTGSGQTVPSYRIPILWENFLCCLRNALAPPPAPEPVVKPSKKPVKSRKVNVSS